MPYSDVKYRTKNGGRRTLYTQRRALTLTKDLYWSDGLHQVTVYTKKEGLSIVIISYRRKPPKHNLLW